MTINFKDKTLKIILKIIFKVKHRKNRSIESAKTKIKGFPLKFSLY